MRLNSLALRLFVTAAAWSMLVLPVAGVILYSVYRSEVEASFNDRLVTLLTVIQADSIERATTAPDQPGDVGEPLFGVIHSGWYWQIKPLDGVAGRNLASPSLASDTLKSPFENKVPPDNNGVRWTDASGPDAQPIRVAETVYAMGDEVTGPRYSFAVGGPLDWLEERVAAFRARLVMALALAGLGLVAATLFQVRFGLRPLTAIERGLAAIRSGTSAKLEGRLPAEIEPLQHELNALIQSNQDIVERARTQVGNLAHALKTPLAVITNESRDDRSPFAEKVAEQAGIMRDQVNLYLDRARIAARAGVIGRVTEVKPVLEALQRALERIHCDKGVAIAITCPEAARFQGERQDLEEMLGNLLDNACKWARDKVYLTVASPGAKSATSAQMLEILVEDDGPGLSEEQRRRIGKRGMRLDETKPGSGLGLSIASDLAHSYHGALELAASTRGGLLVRLELPAA